ncbi:hypothetical protein PMIN05_007462 [Paraphaeosphaeria minitans]
MNHLMACSVRDRDRRRSLHSHAAHGTPATTPSYNTLLASTSTALKGIVPMLSISPSRFGPCMISQCEYARLYLEFSGLALDAALPAHLIHSCNNDFEVRRDALRCWYTWLERLSLGPPERFCCPLSCPAYLVKRFANPDPGGSNFPIMGAKDVLFTRHVFGWHMVQFVLQRPLRLLNRMLFWLCLWGGWRNPGSWGKSIGLEDAACTSTRRGVRQTHAGVSPSLRTDPPVTGTRSAVVEAQSKQGWRHYRRGSLERWVISSMVAIGNTRVHTVMLQYSPLSDYAFQLSSMGALDPKIRQQQLTYIAQLGADSDFTLDADAATTAEFTRLAVDFLGWTKGCEQWCRHWRKCFQEEYRCHCRSGNFSGTDRPRSPPAAAPKRSKLSRPSLLERISSEKVRV